MPRVSATKHSHSHVVADYMSRHSQVGASNLNNAGMNLFSVLAEVDGAGIPLAYFFIKPGCMADNGAQTNLLDQFLRHFRHSGFMPTFFGVDKDTAEISAVHQVWPETGIQLCYWHSKRALRTKLNDSKKTATQQRYVPGDAQNLVPELEICWGSLVIRRPNGDHRYGRCQCPSRSVGLRKRKELSPQRLKRGTRYCKCSADITIPIH